VLSVEHPQVDAHRFETLLERGRGELAGGDAESAAATLRDALALWRGPALADVCDCPAASAEAARLEEARLLALEERIQADLACGRHGALVGELESLVRVDLRVLDAQHVARCAGQERFARSRCGKRFAKARDEHPHRPRRRRRRPVSPQLIDQTIRGHGSSRIEQQQRKQRACLRGLEVELKPVELDL
jgi:hypothetical protein